MENIETEIVICSQVEKCKEDCIHKTPHLRQFGCNQPCTRYAKKGGSPSLGATCESITKYLKRFDSKEETPRAKSNLMLLTENVGLKRQLHSTESMKDFWRDFVGKEQEQNRIIKADFKKQAGNFERQRLSIVTLQEDNDKLQDQLDNSQNNLVLRIARIHELTEANKQILPLEGDVKYWTNWYWDLYMKFQQLQKENKELQDKIAILVSEREILMQSLSTIGDLVSKVTG